LFCRFIQIFPEKEYAPIKNQAHRQAEKRMNKKKGEPSVNSIFRQRSDDHDRSNDYCEHIQRHVYGIHQKPSNPLVSYDKMHFTANR